MARIRKHEGVLASEEGARIAGAMFDFIGKVRLYNSLARSVALHLIEKEFNAQEDSVEKAFLGATLSMIHHIDQSERTALIASLSPGDGA